MLFSHLPFPRIATRSIFTFPRRTCETAKQTIARCTTRLANLYRKNIRKFCHLTVHSHLARVWENRSLELAAAYILFRCSYFVVLPRPVRQAFAWAWKTNGTRGEFSLWSSPDLLRYVWMFLWEAFVIKTNDDTHLKNPATTIALALIYIYIFGHLVEQNNLFKIVPNDWIFFIEQSKELIY